MHQSIHLPSPAKRVALAPYVKVLIYCPMSTYVLVLLRPCDVLAETD